MATDYSSRGCGGGFYSIRPRAELTSVSQLRHWSEEISARLTRVLSPPLFIFLLFIGCFPVLFFHFDLGASPRTTSPSLSLSSSSASSAPHFPSTPWSYLVSFCSCLMFVSPRRLSHSFSPESAVDPGPTRCVLQIPTEALLLELQRAFTSRDLVDFRT